MDGEVLTLLERLERETGLSKDKIKGVLCEALKVAAESKFGSHKHIEVEVDEKSGDIRINVNKKKVLVKDLGRIAALKVRQIIMQRIKEEEKNLLYEKFKEKKGEIIHGVVERRDGRDFIIEVDRAELLLPHKELLPQDNFYRGERIKAFVLEVNKELEYPVLLSRTHPLFLEALLLQEVPELKEGIVTIKKIVREPGYRAKVAVESKKEKIDSIGALVGIKGTRIKPVVQELRGEKIDIIVYSDEVEKFIAQALSPAQVEEVELFPEEKRARVIVNDDQLSLAIGKKGQNVSLAVRLTEWNLDVRPLSQAIKDKKKSKEEIIEELTSLPGLNKKKAKRLINIGFFGLEDISRTPKDELSRLLKVGEEEAQSIISSAKNILKEKGIKVG
ncbi:transcription termination factor NusA [Candidatus Calescamantes bacterium]|nr:transcription termination factor NusA [Candidatus Calescamantes bacterium]